MPQINKLLGFALFASFALTACTADIKANVNANLPNVLASIKPSVSPSAQASAPVGTPASPDPSAAPSQAPNPSASAASTGKIIVSGADAFNAFNIEFRVGMKWVYKMSTQLPVTGVSLPAGVSIPGFSGGGSTMDLGTMTMEVTQVNGDMVTISTKVDNKVSAAASTSSTNTFPKRALASLYAEATSPGAEGTLDWTKGESGSVTVPAGTYSATAINGKMSVKSQASGGSGTVNSDIKAWIANGVGMVKEEVKSLVDASAGGASTSSNSTTLIELQSFSN